VKIGMPAVLITAAALATVVTACSSSPPSAAANQHHGASPGITAGPKGASVVLSGDPVCRQFQKDLKAWKAAIAEPGDAATVLLNASTRPAWMKFGRQLGQLSQAETAGKNPRQAARTARTLARSASLLTLQGTEPIRQFTGMQYERTVVLLEEVTGDCTAVSG
jgi:hypothetical protein